MSNEKENEVFFHLGWLSIALGILSFCVLTPFVAPIALALGVASGVKGQVMGWIGTLLATISGCLWIAWIMLTGLN